MDAHKAIELAEKDVKELKKGVNKLMGKHTRNLEAELNGIIKLLDKLQVVVTGLKTMIESFKFRFSITEVEDFQKTLQCHKAVCGKLSPQVSNLSDELHNLEKSLQVQLDILQGKKPPSSQPESGVIIKGLTDVAVTYTPPMLKGIFNRGLEAVRKVKPEGTPKPGAKEMFETLDGRVETLMKTRGGHLGTKLASIRSKLIELKPVKVNYIQKIEEKTKDLHFCIREVEDLKKELSKGIKVCRLDIYKAPDWQKISDELHEFDKSLQVQVDILKSNIISHEHGVIALFHHKH